MVHAVLCSEAVKSIPVVFALVSVGCATGAFASSGEEAVAMLGFSLLEISCKASTAGSAASSSSSNSAARSVECDVSSDCHGDYVCRKNFCLHPLQPDVPSSHAVRAVSTQPIGCPTGMVCDGPEPKPAPAVLITHCVSDSECRSSQTCSNGQCATIPPAPSSSLRRQGSELYLRERSVELREELALGRGPVINALANMEGVPAQALGRALREHRAELAQLMGDGPGWSAKFLTRVDALCRPS